MPSIKGKKHTGGSQKRIAGSERKISGSEQSSDPDPLTRNNQSVFSTARLHYVAADGCALFMREAIDKMDDNTLQLYLKYHFSTCERQDLLGITSHAIDIFRKTSFSDYNI